MKKKISAVVAVTLALCVLMMQVVSFSIFASDEGTITLSDASGKPGDTITVDVTLASNPGIMPGNIMVTFDESVLTLTGVADGGLFPEGTSAAHKPEKVSPYTLSWANDLSTENFTGTGTLATLTFEIAADTTVNYTSVDVSYTEFFNVDFELISFSCGTAAINIEQSEPEVPTTVEPIEETTAPAPDEETTIAPEPIIEETTAAPVEVVTTEPVEETTAAPVFEGPVIMLGSATAVDGKADVPVYLINNPGIMPGNVVVDFDENVLTLESVTDTGLMPGTASHKPELVSPYTLSWVDDLATENFTGEGQIATLHFAVKDGITDATTLIELNSDTQFFNVDFDQVIFSGVSGTVTIGEPVPTTAKPEPVEPTTGTPATVQPVTGTPSPVEPTTVVPHTVVTQATDDTSATKSTQSTQSTQSTDATKESGATDPTGSTSASGATGASSTTKAPTTPAPVNPGTSGTTTVVTNTANGAVSTGTSGMAAVAFTVMMSALAVVFGLFYFRKRSN